jgi:hypothetical protein
VAAYIEVPEANLKRFHDMIDAKATGAVPAVNKTGYDRGKEAGMKEGNDMGRHHGGGRTARSGPRIPVRPPLLRRC